MSTVAKKSKLYPQITAPHVLSCLYIFSNIHYLLIRSEFFHLIKCNSYFNKYLLALQPPAMWGTLPTRALPPVCHSWKVMPGQEWKVFVDMVLVIFLISAG